MDGAGIAGRRWKRISLQRRGGKASGYCVVRQLSEFAPMLFRR